MKKIEKVQIAGYSFFFEDDAFSLLEKFIRQIQRLYEGNGEELKVADTETRIAGMCHDRVGENGIVTAAIIEDIISLIGIKVEEPCNDSATKENVSSEDDTNEKESTWYKAMLKGNRLFRNKHCGILGGVLSGIAMYHNIDVTLLRVITLLLFILPMQIPVMLVYIILWVVLPKAVTIMDYTRMRRIEEKGNDEAVKKAWKNNYEMAVAELSVPSEKGCMYSFVRIMFFILATFAIIPLSVLILWILFCLFVFAIAGWGLFGAFNVPFMMGIGVVALVVIPVCLLVHFILKKANVCAPMKRNTKIFFVALWVIALLLVAPVLHRYIENNGGYDNIGNIIEYKLESVKAVFDGDFEDFVGMGGDVNYSYSSKYNIRDIDTDYCDAVIYTMWDVHNDTGRLPFVIESLYKSNGRYDVTFYTCGDSLSDTQEKLLDEDYDARITTTFMPFEEVNGWEYFAWDSIGGILYYEEFSKGESFHESLSTEAPASKIKLRTFESVDDLSYDNASEKGLLPFRIFYYGYQRPPSLVVTCGTGDRELEATSTKVCLKGAYISKYDYFVIVNENAIKKIDSLVNDITVKVNEIVDVSKNVVDLD